MSTQRIHTPDPGCANPTPGALNDDGEVRAIVTQAIKSSRKSREQIAEQMSYLLGERVTERMLSAYTSEAMKLHRFPLHFARAFCCASEDYRLLRCVAERAGLTVIEADDVKILEIGRQYLKRKSAEAALRDLEQSLGGE